MMMMMMMMMITIVIMIKSLFLLWVVMTTDTYPSAFCVFLEQLYRAVSAPFTIEMSTTKTSQDFLSLLDTGLKEIKRVDILSRGKESWGTRRNLERLVKFSI